MPGSGLNYIFFGRSSYREFHKRKLQSRLQKSGFYAKVVLNVILIIDLFFSAKASPEKKYQGFSVAALILTMDETSKLDYTVVFSPNLMRCWINQLAANDRMLHPAAKHFVRLLN